MTLTKNCRNTVSIHHAAYGHYRGEPIDPPENDGAELVFDKAPNLTSQARKVHSRIVDLIDQQSVSAKDITVLIGDARNKAGYYASLKDLPLPGRASWLEEGYRSENEVLLETVNRFKGLESQIIILWGLDGLDLHANNELLYVGLSRAKSLLIVCATPAIIDQL